MMMMTGILRIRRTTARRKTTMMMMTSLRTKQPMTRMRIGTVRRMTGGVEEEATPKIRMRKKVQGLGKMMTGRELFKVNQQ